MKPNIVIIMTDQQRADQCGREGFPLDTTPFLDSLASRGVWFNRAYTAAPLCVPARISMLTGRYPSTHRVVVNHGIQNAIYDCDLFDVVKQLGYATALVGKNHSHLTPEKLDFWFELGHMGGEGSERTKEDMEFGKWLSSTQGVGMEPAPFPIEIQGPHRVVTNAISWIDSLKEASPFCLWLSIAEPHTPNQVPEPYFSMFPPEALPPVSSGSEVLPNKPLPWRWIRTMAEKVYPDYEAVLQRMRSNYLGMLRLIDDQIKRFAEFLEHKGLMENTLIVFLADHGDFVGEYGLMRKGPGVPEVLTRIPMFFTGPGIKAGTNPKPEFVSIADIMPTLCEMLDVPLPRGCQGKSLWPVLSGGEYPADDFSSAYIEQGYGGLHYTEEELEFTSTFGLSTGGLGFDGLNSCTQCGTMRAVCKGEWKLILDMQGNGELYNLLNDPFETVNLYGKTEYREIQCELLESLSQWMLRMQDPLMLPSKGKYKMKCDKRNYWSSYS